MNALTAYAAGQARVPAGSSAGGQFAGGGMHSSSISEHAHAVDRRGTVKPRPIHGPTKGATVKRQGVDKRGVVIVNHPAYPDSGYQTFRQVLTTAGQVLASRITGFA